MAEGTSDLVEVPSDQYSCCDLNDNMYLYFIIRACKELESKMGEWEKPNR